MLSVDLALDLPKLIFLPVIQHYTIYRNLFNFSLTNFQNIVTEDVIFSLAITLGTWQYVIRFFSVCLDTNATESLISRVLSHYQHVIVDPFTDPSELSGTWETEPASWQEDSVYDGVGQYIVSLM